MHAYERMARQVIYGDGRDGHEASVAETETRSLQVSRRDRDVEMHVVFNAVQVNVGLKILSLLSPRVRLF